jgi:hypothetical protein
MSTNFYATWPNQAADDTERLHIGKRSVGWEFLWRAYPGMGITSVEAWRGFFAHPFVTIESEGGEVRTVDEFMAIAAQRSEDVTGPHPMIRQFGWGMTAGQSRDAEGYPFDDHEFC